MKNKLLLIIISFFSASIIIFSCAKEKAVVLSTDFSFTESFDTVSAAVAKGWVIANNSKPIGTIGWMQGFFYVSLYHGFTPGKTGGPFNYASAGGFSGNNPSFSGADFIMTTAECGSGRAYCSNWLISPEVTIKDGDQISFYTRTYENPAAGADRLELRINAADATANVGRDSTSVGGFTNLILEINPNYLLDGDDSYPGEWTQYSATVTGMPVAKKSRIALRYNVANSGPLGENGVGVGIDQFEFISK